MSFKSRPESGYRGVKTHINRQLIHSLGAAYRNALELIVEVTRGSTKKQESMECRVQAGT